MSKDGSAVLTGTVAYLLASVFWGLNIPLTVTLFKSFDPFWVSPVRYVIASVLLAAWVVVGYGPRSLRSPIPLWRVAMLSLLVSCFLTLFSLGMFHSHPIVAATISAGSPVYVAIVSRLWLGAPLERGFWGATALTLIGTGIAISGRAADAVAGGGAGAGAGAGGAGVQLRGGEILLVLSICCWTVYSVLAQRWFTADTPQLRRTFLSSIGTIPWLLLFWSIARAAGLVGAPNLLPDAQALTNVTLSAVFCTALATVAWNTGVSRLGIATGALWQNTIPVFAVLISALFFGIVPNASQVLGGAVVLGGVLYMQWLRYRAR